MQLSYRCDLRDHGDSVQNIITPIPTSMILTKLWICKQLFVAKEYMQHRQPTICHANYRPKTGSPNLIREVQPINPLPTSVAPPPRATIPITNFFLWQKWTRIMMVPSNELFSCPASKEVTAVGLCGSASSCVRRILFWHDSTGFAWWPHCHHIQCIWSLHLLHYHHRACT